MAYRVTVGRVISTALFVGVGWLVFKNSKRPAVGAVAGVASGAASALAANVIVRMLPSKTKDPSGWMGPAWWEHAIVESGQQPLLTSTGTSDGEWSFTHVFSLDKDMTAEYDAGVFNFSAVATRCFGPTGRVESARVTLRESGRSQVAVHFMYSGVEVPADDAVFCLNRAF